jgi:Ca-activated chloride channel family protein
VLPDNVVAEGVDITSVWPKAGLAGVMVAVGVVVGVLVGGAWRDNGDGEGAAGSAASECSGGAETLNIAADEAVVPIVGELADRYSADLQDHGRPCVRIEVRPVASSAVAGRLTNGWSTDTHGPRPDVWIPKSTLWVELLRQQVSDDIVSEDPTVLARSPTVMALPKPMAEQLGWPDTRMSWAEFLELADDDDGWARHGAQDWGAFRLDVPDPRYTTTGLQALLALDSAQEGGVERATPLSLYRVQRALAAIDASTSETLDRYLTTDQPMRTLSALPIEERELWRFNATGTPTATESASEVRAAALASEGDTVDGGPPELVAMYPSGGDGIAMESDYPYVQLDTTWVSDAVYQFADEFGDYLRSDAGVEQFTEAGFRTRDNEPGEVLRADDCLTALDDITARPPGELPDVTQFRKLRSSWITVPRSSRTLYLLDVSGSMVEFVPGTGRTRLQATVEAAKRSIDIIPGGSDVGLWEFSTGLGGDDSPNGDYRELVPLGRLDAFEGSQTHKRRLLSALDDIDAEQDTALYDSLLAAYQELRRSYTPGRRHLIVLLTDGRNDDDRSITREQLLLRLQRLHRSQEPIQVVSIAYGEQADVDALSEISDVVGGRVIASPEAKKLDTQFIQALRR